MEYTSHFLPSIIIAICTTDAIKNKGKVYIYLNGNRVDVIDIFIAPVYI